jgi:hypothetical protein
MTNDRREAGWGDDDEWDEEDETEAGFMHLGYYVRRVEGVLVLVQTFVVNTDTGAGTGTSVDVQMAYLDRGDLDEAWLEAIDDQGQHLIEGKSVEFMPPDDDLDDDDIDEDGDEFAAEDDLEDAN